MCVLDRAVRVGEGPVLYMGNLAGEHWDTPGVTGELPTASSCGAVDARPDPNVPPLRKQCRVQQQQLQQRNNSGPQLSAVNYQLNSLNPEVAEYLQVPPKAMQ